MTGIGFVPKNIVMIEMLLPFFAGLTLVSWWVVAVTPADAWWMLPVLCMQLVGWFGALAGSPRHVDASHRAFAYAMGAGWMLARHAATRLLWAGLAAAALAGRSALGRCPFEGFEGGRADWWPAETRPDALLAAAVALYLAPLRPSAALKFSQ